MAGFAELHDWTAVSGGYRCQSCGAIISDSQIASNKPVVTDDNYSSANPTPWVLDDVSVIVNGF